MKAIKLFEDDLTEKDCKDLPLHRGARGIIRLDDKVLIIYNKNWDLYTLPGGGIESTESDVEALHREVLEETGYTIKNVVKTLVLTEYFHDSVWEHHFFSADADQLSGEVLHTQEELAAGMTLKTMLFTDAITLFSSHITDHLNSDNIYQREFLGLIHSLED